MATAVFKEMCETCVFRPGNQMHLNPGRLADLIQANLNADALLTCHKTTYRQRSAGEVYCRGFWDRFGSRTNQGRIMARLGIPEVDE